MSNTGQISAKNNVVVGGFSSVVEPVSEIQPEVKEQILPSEGVDKEQSPLAQLHANVSQLADLQARMSFMVSEINKLIK